MKEGDKVRLKEEYKPGSNTVDYEWAVIDRLFLDDWIEEAWLTTNKGQRITEYLEYLEPINHTTNEN